MGLGYRPAQFVHALTTRPTADDVSLAEQNLPASLLPLFHRLSRPDKAHALSVLRTLLARGAHDPDLLTAALLHDLGKSAVPLHLGERVLIVLVQRLAPTTARRWGQGSPCGWRRGFVVAAHHPEWGASMVQRAGGSARLVNLIRHHQVESDRNLTDTDPLLALLRLADGDN